MTAKQEKLIENYVRTKVRSMLKEESKQHFVVYKRQVNPSGLVEIETYNVQEVADKVCKVLNAAAPNMRGQRNKSGQDYIVKAENSGQY